MDFLFENITPKQTVLKNTFWLYLGNFISKLFKLLIIILSARYLGAEGYGHFSYILSIIGIFFVFSDWGSSFLMVRDYQNENNKNKLINNFITFRIFLLLISFLFIFSGFFLFRDNHSRLIFFITFIFFFINQVKQIIISFFEAIKKMEYEGIANIIESFFILLFVILFLRQFNDPLYLSLGYLFGIIITFLFSLRVFLKIFDIKNFYFSFNKFKYFLINGTPLLFFGILGFIFFSSDQIVLGYIKGYQEVGYYSLATKIILNLNLIIAFFLTALLPSISEIKYDNQRMKKILARVFVYNFLIYLSIMMFIILTPHNFIELFVGNNYQKTIYLIKFLSPFLLLISNISILDNILFVYNQQWKNFLITFICALLNLLLNFLLIPNYGSDGAALATYLSQILNLLLSFYLVKKILSF
ncbi:MAG: hypothetical protein KatS3mg095_0343 [Candidatus Parcubacteria bacterium]|nr:MAG: hypothetical protein KatS3mg095_0343 [Candidatus Parcubacteria bacterium]